MNTIYIELSDGVTVIKAPILDDFPIEAVSEFSTFGELVPIMDQLVTLGTAMQSSGTGTTSKTALLARSVLDAPRWTKTNPIKITIDLHFYTETDAEKDVTNKVNTLMGLHVLSRGEKGRIKIPGFNAKNIKEISKVLSDKSASDSSKKLASATQANFKTQFGTDDAEEVLKNMTDAVISVLIPGVVYLPLAYIHAVQPTYSKFKTNFEFPLWATLNVQIVSLTPAMLDNFTDGATLNDVSDNIIMDMNKRWL
jgi:hypothetical protein